MVGGEILSRGPHPDAVQPTQHLTDGHSPRSELATATSASTYGPQKVVDSRDRCAADGTKQQRQRRQLEVFQAQVPGGSIQVIRTQTVASSSSKWSSTSRDSSSATLSNTTDAQHFDNLQLALYPLDSSSQKTKASVGRSGSIGGRRPPSRPRAAPDHASAPHSVSRLCHQLHAEAVAQSTRPASRLKPADGSVTSTNHTNSATNVPSDDAAHTNGYSSSGSSPIPFHQSFKPEPPRNWSPPVQQRASPKPDLETGRRLSTALRGNNIDLDALDQILKTISCSSTADETRDDEKSEKDTNCTKEAASAKRESFITVESLQEVRGRLRRLSSPTDEFYKEIERVKDEEPDDGIVAEDNSMMKREEANGVLTASPGMSRVRSYVYGMEAMLHKKPIIGTGSLESRTSNKSSGSSTSRSEDWYNRRKSYGFEQVHNPQIDQTNSISMRGKNKIESSTDSGICRSIEIVVVPSVVKSQAEPEAAATDEDPSRYNAYKSVPIYNKTGTSTVINLGGDKTKCNSSSSVSVNVDPNDPYTKQTNNNELFAIWNKRARANDNPAEKLKNESEQITITIPIVSEEESCNSNIRRVFHRQLSEGTSVSVESSWSNKQNDMHDVKRHSIAVDESKYVHGKCQFPQLRRTSLAIAENGSKHDEATINDGLDDETINHLGKKQKKVEFCKTEVHFAAESGKVNIVETDEKPPPNNNFRNRRRRNSAVTNNHYVEDFNKNGLPLIHFGDTSYEKKLFGISDHENAIVPQIEPSESFVADANPYSNGLENTSCNNTVTVSSVSITKDYELDQKENHEVENPPRGILKNKMVKPKPYILGDNNHELISKDTNEEQPENSIWGVRLRPVHKQEETQQIWKSTVTVQNTTYNKPTRETITEHTHSLNSSTYEAKLPENSQPEFQKLLQSLRPARKSEPSIVSSESVSEPKVSQSMESRRSSWSVADLVRQVEDMRTTESKGYSTKVNFGSGEATVVENVDVTKHTERHTTWPTSPEEAHNKDEQKQSSILNKGLVVRIGREDSNHTVCSKTTTNHNSNSTTTTTKITIDMSPSPTDADNYPPFSAIKLPRASLHSLKSTSLIMNTFARPEQIVSVHSRLAREPTPPAPAPMGAPAPVPRTIPDQLAALRKLYDEAAEHSDDSEKADEEVRSYMSGGGDDSDLHDTEDDVSSVVSGSWSKMRAFHHISQHLAHIHCDSSRQKETEMFRNIINRHAHVKKDFSSSKQTFQPSAQKRTVLNTVHPTEKRSPIYNSAQEKRSPTDSKAGIVSVRCSLDRKSSDTSLTDSPQPERRQMNASKKPFESLKVQYSNGSLSSPSLVGSSIQKSTRSYQTKKTESVILQAKPEDKKHAEDREERTSAFSKITTSNHAKDSPSLGRKYVIRRNPPSYASSQPMYSRRTEAATKKLDSSSYYSEIQTRKPTKKLSERSREQKPDLLQHYGDNRQYVNLSSVIKENSKSSVASKVNVEESKNGSTKKKSTRPDSPSVERAESPIYENIDDVLNGLTNGIEKESSILQELTKAADQILQAVNGYTDDDSTKLSTDEEDEGRRHRIKNFKKTGEVLSTISETKSWKQVQTTKQKQTEVSRNIKNVRSKVRPTSSTSSIESVTRDCQKSVVRQQRVTNKPSEDKTKKKITGTNSELIKATRARRLQRASSREALLQSHGSSSEDISTTAEVVRKPRLVRRLKTQHSTTSDDVNSSSKKSVVSQTNVRRVRECDIRRSSERTSVTGLQEIRHRTAVSTIKSTAEKAASREKAAKLKSEELRKRVSSRRDTSSTKGGSVLSQTGAAVLGGGRPSGGVGADGCVPVSAVRTSSGVYVPAYRCNSLVAISRTNAECPCLCS